MLYSGARPESRELSSRGAWGRALPYTDRMVSSSQARHSIRCSNPATGIGPTSIPSSEGGPTPNMALQRTRRPRIRSGRSLRSLGSPLNAYSLGHGK